MFGFLINQPPNVRFFDLHLTSWFYDYAMTVYNAGIFEAWSASSFAPREKMTHGMFAQALHNLSGGSTSIRVHLHDEALTREELVVMLYDFALAHGRQLPTGRGVFRDITNLSSHSQDAINAMHRASVVFGRSHTSFAPHDYATRAEAAVILVRFMNVMGFR